MPGSDLQSARVAFGTFEADLSTGELWRGGFRIKLQGQPFRVLAELVQHPGQVVTREELQQRVWDKGTNVDFDHSLGTAINKIREALGDNAENPRYVETLTRRGYRFIAPVRLLDTIYAPPTAPDDTGDRATPNAPREEAATTPAASAATPAVLPSAQTEHRLPHTWLYAAAGGVALVSAGLAGYFAGHTGPIAAIPEIRQITHAQRILPGGNATEAFPVMVTDGLHLFASVIRDGSVHLERITIRGGESEPVVLPDEIAGPAIADISHDGSRLLVRSHASNQSEQPLFIVPTGGGSAQRVMRVTAHDATWMPDDTTILYAAGNDLYLSTMSDDRPTAYATLPGRAFWLRWSPDGKILRFTLFDPLAHTQSLWELTASDHHAHPILSTWAHSHDVCCGTWTQDGDFIVQSNTGSSSDLWLLHGRSEAPTRLTNGPLAYQGPVAGRSDHNVYLTGVSSEGELQFLAPGSHSFTPATGFYSGSNRIEQTRDGRWVAWVDGAGKLWRARTDGSELLQLTPPDLQVFTAHWSPDGTRIAIMARREGGAWSIFQEVADGSDLQPLLETGSNAADPTWSPDGTQIVLGQAPDLLGKDAAPRTIQILDLRTHTRTALSGSVDLFSPRWSPDGRYIAALSLDQRQIKLYDLETRQWRVLSSRSAADPVWSPDSRSLYADAFMDPGQPLYRVAIADGRIDELADIASFHSPEFSDFVLCGVFHDGTVAVRARLTTANLYRLDLGTPDGRRN